MNLDNILTIDLETLPPSDPALEARIRAEIAPPAQYKKPDSIAQWMAENADAVAAERLHALGLDGLYGSICVAGFAAGGGDPVMIYGRQDERSLIEGYFNLIDIAAGNRADGASRDWIVVGHNVEFDLRYLLHRAVRFGLVVPRSLRKAFDPEKGRYQVRDTMKLWAGYGGRVKLKTLAHELIGENPTDIDGSEVAKVWATDPEKVVEHCAADIQRTRAIYVRLATTLGLG